MADLILLHGDGDLPPPLVRRDVVYLSFGAVVMTTSVLLVLLLLDVIS